MSQQESYNFSSSSQPVATPAASSTPSLQPPQAVSSAGPSTSAADTSSINNLGNENPQFTHAYIKSRAPLIPTNKSVFPLALLIPGYLDALRNFRAGKTYTREWCQAEPIWKTVAIPQNFIDLQISVLFKIKREGSFPVKPTNYKSLFHSYWLVAYGNTRKRSWVFNFFAELPPPIQLSWRLAYRCAWIWMDLAFPGWRQESDQKGSQSLPDWSLARHGPEESNLGSHGTEETASVDPFVGMANWFRNATIKGFKECREVELVRIARPLSFTGQQYLRLLPTYGTSNPATSSGDTARPESSVPPAVVAPSPIPQAIPQRKKVARNKKSKVNRAAESIIYPGPMVMVPSHHTREEDAEALSPLFTEPDDDHDSNRGSEMSFEVHDTNEDRRTTLRQATNPGENLNPHDFMNPLDFAPVQPEPQGPHTLAGNLEFQPDWMNLGDAIGLENVLSMDDMSTFPPTEPGWDLDSFLSDAFVVPQHENSQDNSSFVGNAYYTESNIGHQERDSMTGLTEVQGSENYFDLTTFMLLTDGLLPDPSSETDGRTMEEPGNIPDVLGLLSLSDGIANDADSNQAAFNFPESIVSRTNENPFHEQGSDYKTNPEVTFSLNFDNMPVESTAIDINIQHNLAGHEETSQLLDDQTLDSILGLPSQPGTMASTHDDLQTILRASSFNSWEQAPLFTSTVEYNNKGSESFRQMLAPDQAVETVWESLFPGYELGYVCPSTSLSAPGYIYSSAEEIQTLPLPTPQATAEANTTGNTFANTNFYCDPHSNAGFIDYFDAFTVPEGSQPFDAAENGFLMENLGEDIE